MYHNSHQLTINHTQFHQTIIPAIQKPPETSGSPTKIEDFSPLSLSTFFKPKQKPRDRKSPGNPKPNRNKQRPRRRPPPLSSSLSNSNPEFQTSQRQAGHLRHGAGGAAPHLRPPPPKPLPRGQARRRPRSRLLVLGAPDVAVLIPVARLLRAAPRRRRRAIPGRGRAAALLRAVLAGRHATSCAEAVRARRLYIALPCAIW